MNDVLVKAVNGDVSRTLTNKKVNSNGNKPMNSNMLLTKSVLSSQRESRQEKERTKKGEKKNIEEKDLCNKSET